MEIREPKQKRAILKKKKIIDAGFKLFAEVGYHNTNTAEIAKAAGVSTGIVYGYFKDKRDILLEVLDLYIERAYEPVFQYFDTLTYPLCLTEVVPTIFDKSIDIHIKYVKIHEILHAMTAVDKEINEKFIELEDAMTYKIAERLELAGYTFDNKYEKIHFVINIVQLFSHELVYDKHQYINYDELKKIVEKVIIDVIEGKK